jgi:signal transduction protein with GAF and PtsI domain
MIDRTTQHPLVQEIEVWLAREGASDSALHTLLDKILASMDCAVGTIHGLDPQSGLLQLRAQRGLPPALLDRVRTIPIGKGMAGLAAERRQPVQVCNLQTDGSGCAKPAARETRMEGSIAVPMLVASELRGVLGVAKPVEHEFGDSETTLLLDLASALGKGFAADQSRR